MNLHAKSLTAAVALAAAFSTAVFADTGRSDNTNAIINGDTNQPAERVMDRGTAYSDLTGAGRADNTNAIVANPDDFMREPRHRDSYYAPAPLAVPVVPPDRSYEGAAVRDGSGNPVSQGTYGPNGMR